MSKNIIDPVMLLTSQEHVFMGSTSKVKLGDLGDFYKPDGVLRGEVLAHTASMARESLGTYPLGLMEGVIGAKNVVIKLQKINEETGQTLKDPRLGFLDKEGKFVYDEALTKRLYEIFKKNNIDLQLRESPTAIERESFGAENKG